MTREEALNLIQALDWNRGAGHVLGYLWDITREYLEDDPQGQMDIDNETGIYSYIFKDIAIEHCYLGSDAGLTPEEMEDGEIYYLAGDAVEPTTWGEIEDLQDAVIDWIKYN